MNIKQTKPKNWNLTKYNLKQHRYLKLFNQKSLRIDNFDNIFLKQLIDYLEIRPRAHSYIAQLYCIQCQLLWLIWIGIEKKPLTDSSSMSLFSFCLSQGISICKQVSNEPCSVLFFFFLPTCVAAFNVVEGSVHSVQN